MKLFNPKNPDISFAGVLELANRLHEKGIITSERGYIHFISTGELSNYDTIRFYIKGFFKGWY